LYAHFFADQFRRNVLKREDLITTTRMVDFTSYCIDFSTYRQLYEPKFTEQHKLEHTLFEFSNRIGAFITFVLIQSMNPDNFSGTNLESPKERDLMAKEWVNKAVLVVLPFIIRQFRDSVHKGINKYPRTWEEQKRYFNKSPKFKMEKEIIDDLTRSFTRIYPLVSFEFKKIFQNLSSEIKSYKSWLEQLEQKEKKRSKCKHQFREPRMTIYGFCARQCIKCGYFKNVKECACKIISELESTIENGYQVKEIKPYNIRSDAKLANIAVTLFSKTEAREKTIRALGYAETEALKDYIVSHQELQDVGI
jgi:hypothetical protein